MLEKIPEEEFDSKIDLTNASKLAPFYFNSVVADQLNETNGTITLTAEKFKELILEAFTEGTQSGYYANHLFVNNDGKAVEVGCDDLADGIVENYRQLAKVNLPAKFTQWVYYNLEIQIASKFPIEWETLTADRLISHLWGNKPNAPKPKK